MLSGGMTIRSRRFWWAGRLFKYPDTTVMQIEGRVLAIADCIGDWREEIITSLPGELRIYSSTTPSSWRRPWLMENRLYRLGVVTGSMGYYREPQLSESLGTLGPTHRVTPTFQSATGVDIDRCAARGR
jgi:hypothetical protein